jgi:hypothetical protein
MIERYISYVRNPRWYEITFNNLDVNARWLLMRFALAARGERRCCELEWAIMDD